MTMRVELDETSWYYFVICAVRNKQNYEGINNLLTTISDHNFPVYVNSHVILNDSKVHNY